MEGVGKKPLKTCTFWGLSCAFLETAAFPVLCVGVSGVYVYGCMWQCVLKDSVSPTTVTTTSGRRTEPNLKWQQLLAVKPVSSLSLCLQGPAALFVERDGQRVAESETGDRGDRRKCERERGVVHSL